MRFRGKASSEEISGFLDQETSITGELQFSGTLRIDGTFHGSITTNDILIVGEHAVLHADIKAGEIDVHGKVFGTIEGRRRIEIHSTGRVQADIHTPKLIVDAGGTLDGKSRMAGAFEETTTLADDSEALAKKPSTSSAQ